MPTWTIACIVTWKKEKKLGCPVITKTKFMMNKRGNALEKLVERKASERRENSLKKSVPKSTTITELKQLSIFPVEEINCQPKTNSKK